ncbi:lipid droplet associated hydrolase sturkopf isoform X1 [Tachypleus tridentatus]|uniref:lipid droplet associated hydrolase sturkopf isoform X1 n=2 Tax=Tachypleus tridentatus TaxID=6853 RepID=UPI003FD13421
MSLGVCSHGGSLQMYPEMAEKAPEEGSDIVYSSANDLKFLKHGFVTVNGVPTSVLTCGRWLDEPLPEDDSKQILIILIPGNPGAIEHYEEFMCALYEGLQRAVPIWGISHAGHTAPPPSVKLPKFSENEYLYSLEGQVRHKMVFLNTCVPRDRQLILIGHSIGCYIVLEILKRLPRLNVIRGILLFPIIERMSTTPQGQWMWPLLSYLRLPALFGVYALSYLSPQLQWRLLLWYFKDRPVPECVLRASLNLFHPECARQCMFMAKDELDSVTTLDIDSLKAHVNHLIFYYGSSDQWCPVSYYKDLKEMFPQGDVRLCQYGFEHAFVINNSREVGALVAGWILEGVLETPRDIHSKALLV